MARIEPYNDEDTPFKIWSALAAYGKFLTGPGGEVLFYYDVPAKAATGSPGASPGTGVGNSPETPAILLIHGLGDEADSWRHIIPRLSAAGHWVLALDLPGFGRSRAPGRISLEGHIAAILRLLKETGAAGPAHPAILGGTSMGAIIAEGAAFGRPDLVKGLILLDGCFPSGQSSSEDSVSNLSPAMILTFLPFGKKNERRAYRAFRKNHEGAYLSLDSYYADLEALDEEDRHFLRERVIARVESPTQERAYFASLHSLMGAYVFKASSYIRKLKAWPGRILLLWGEQDRTLPQDTTKRFRELRPDAEFVLIGGAGHLPHQERPVETAEAMLAFIRGLSG
jgi:pimeloyl-ACP methyl ester carboxylesterase